MDDTHSPPKLREAFDAAQHLQTSVRLLRVFNGVLAHGPAPYPYQRWDIVDQVIAAMQRLRDLAEHGPTRQVMQQDRDGTGQALSLLSDPQLAQMLTEIQNTRSSWSCGQARSSNSDQGRPADGALT